MEPFVPLYEHFGFRVKDLRAISEDPDEPVLSPHVIFGEPGEDEVSLEIPTFQRGLRWSNSRRDKFLDSLRQGRPVGTLVLARKERIAKKGKRPARQKWYVIDGQQRIHALNTISSNFWSDAHFDLSSLSKELSDLAKALEIDDKTKIEQAIVELASTDNFVTKYLAETTHLLDALVLELNVDEKLKTPEAETPTQRIRLNLQQQFTSFEEYELSTHVVILPEKVFTDVERRIAITEIFRAVNSGLKLDPNDLLAALWDQYKVVWPPRELPKTWKDSFFETMFDDMRNRVSKSYDDAEAFDTEIEQLVKENVSFYDFVYALRQVTLSDPMKAKATRERQVFVPKGERDKIDSDLALQVLSLFLTGGVRGTDELETKHLAGGTTFSRGSNDSLLVDECLRCYNTAVRAVEDSLVPHFELNTTTANTKMVGKTEATTYLANFLAISYSPKFSKREEKLKWGTELMTVSALQTLWKKNLAAWWLYDIFQGELVGSSAIPEAATLTWTNFDKDDPDSHIPNLRMCGAPNVDDFREVFENVFYSGASRGTPLPQRPRASKAAVALMRLVYTHHPLGNKPLDLDHLVPYKRSGNPPTWPKNRKELRLNHPANWMPISQDHNRGRGNDSWAGHINKISNPREKTNIKNRLMLPVSEFNNDARDSNEAFLTLMTRRWAQLFSEAMETLNLEEWTRKSKTQQLGTLDILTNNIVDRMARNQVVELDQNKCSVSDL